MSKRTSKLLSGELRYTGRSAEEFILAESARRFPQFLDDSLWGVAPSCAASSRTAPSSQSGTAPPGWPEN